MSNAPRNATVTTKTPSVLMKLDRQQFNAIFGSLQDILAREAERREVEASRSQKPRIELASLTHVATIGAGSFARIKLVRHAG